jgi:hypothetical protein
MGSMLDAKRDATQCNYCRIATIRCRTCVLVSLFGAYSHPRRLSPSQCRTNGGKTVFGTGLNLLIGVGGAGNCRTTRTNFRTSYIRQSIPVHRTAVQKCEGPYGAASCERCDRLQEPYQSMRYALRASSKSVAHVVVRPIR